jgi:hypothetical protein
MMPEHCTGKIVLPNGVELYALAIDPVDQSLAQLRFVEIGGNDR